MKMKNALMSFGMGLVFLQSAFALDAYTAINRYKMLNNGLLKMEVKNAIHGEYESLNSDLTNITMSVGDTRIKTLVIQGEAVKVSEDGTVSLEKDFKFAPGLNRVTVIGLAQDGKTVLAEKSLNVLKKFSNYNEKSGVIGSSTTWKKSEGPYLVLGEVVVNPGVTLTIEPGTTIFFDHDAKMTVKGQLNADGNSNNWIYFTRRPDRNETWNGIHFEGTRAENHINYSWLTYGQIKDEGMVGVNNSKLLIENSVLGKTLQRKIVTMESSTIIRNNLFMSPYGVNEDPVFGLDSEHIKGKHVPEGSVLIIENNIFEKLKGYNDAIDYSVEPYFFLAPKKVGAQVQPIFRFNAFLGGGDDAFDLDADAIIEGNFITGFKKDQWNTSAGQSNAISTGKKHSILVKNNIFTKLDILATLKADAFMTFTNNTVVDVRIGIELYNDEKKRQGYGKGVLLKNNIFYKVGEPLKFITSKTDIKASYNFGPNELLGKYGKGNIDWASVDPLFVDYSNQNFVLRADSSLNTRGENGVKLGVQ